jgi:hypothetical protein
MTVFEFLLSKEGNSWVLQYYSHGVKQKFAGEDPQTFLAKLEKDFAGDIFVYKRIGNNFAYFKIVALKIVKRFPFSTDYKDIPPEKQVQKLVVEDKLNEILELKPSYVEKLEGNKWFVVVPAQKALDPPKGLPKANPKKICARCYDWLPNKDRERFVPSNEKGNCDICGLHDVGLFILSGGVK